MNNLPAMTEEQRQALIKMAKKLSSGVEGNLIANLAKIALVTLTTKPVGYFEHHVDEDGDETDHLLHTDQICESSFPLYTAPAAPVLRVPNELKVKNGSHQSHIDYAEGWADCIDEVKRLNAQPSPPEASNEQ